MLTFNQSQIESGIDSILLKNGKGPLSLSNGTGQPGPPLEDYIEEIQRAAEQTTTDTPMMNMESQLALKERELILAAELGKALLERNNELTLANERITEDYSHKLEVSANIL